MSNKQKQTPFLKTNIATIALIQLLLTGVVVLSGYYYSNRILIGMDKKIQDQLHSSAGGEENYKLLQELQKTQVQTYIQEYGKQNPDELAALKRKIAATSESVSGVSYGKLEQNEVQELSKNIPSNETLISEGPEYLLVEFTQIDCEHCKKLERDGIIEAVSTSFSGGVSVVKKIIAKSNSKNSVLGEKAYCMGIAGGITGYNSAIHSLLTPDTEDSGVLNTIIGGGDDLYEFNRLEESYKNNKKYTECLTSGSGKASIEKNRGQGLYLGINSTPTILFVRKKDGQFIRFDGLLAKEIYMAEISKFH